jgi:hypothetical protein
MVATDKLFVGKIPSTIGPPQDFGLFLTRA